MPTFLTPKPFRGDQVAAGTVVLAVLVLMLNVRFSGEWSDGVNFAYTAAAAALVLAMAFAAPREPEGPPAWHSTLYVSGFLLLFGALANLASVLGSESLTASTATWIGALLTLLAVWIAYARGAASGTLLAGITGVITTLVFVQWAFSPHGSSTFRYILLLDVVILVLVALWLRIRGPVHAVQALNVAGLALLGIGVSFALAGLSGLFLLLGSGDGGSPGLIQISWGWTALVLVGALGLLAAGAADRERGNTVIGVTLLFAFVTMAGDGDLKGWPIPLAAGALVLLVLGLRPSTPLPSEPPRTAGAGGGAPSSAPLPRTGEDAGASSSVPPPPT